MPSARRTIAGLLGMALCAGIVALCVWGMIALVRGIVF